MAKRLKRPTHLLLVDELAAIERCRALVRYDHAPRTWTSLFPPRREPFDFVPPGQEVAPAQPAILQVELRDYSCALLDCEAQQYKLHAKDEAEVRSSLEIIAECIQAETIRQTQAHFEGVRCTLAERKKAVSAGLKQRIEHWVKTYREEKLKLLARRTVTLDPPMTPLGGTYISKPSVPTKVEAEILNGNTLSEQLDEIVLRENISHEELASRIGIGRTTYFEVKARRGGRKARRKTELYLETYYQQHPRQKRTDRD